MSLRHVFTIGLLFFLFNTHAQDTIRLRTFKNQLEILKDETPGLGEKTGINTTKISLGNFFIALAKAHNININVSPELNSINIINNYPNVTVDKLLLFFVKEYDLDMEFTENIISIKPYHPPPPQEDTIKVQYNLNTRLMTLDLNNDKLDRVFRRIMDLTKKNLLFSPQIQNTPLTLYIKEVPLEVALDKLAVTNNLILTTTRDGFFVFDEIYSDSETGTIANNRSRINRQANFYHKVLDTVGRRLEVDFQNTPISDIIYTLSEALKLNVFTASPLDNVGLATVKAKNIKLDLLLTKIFESAMGPSDNSSEVFTYKKEGDLYFFGTENQLSLKQTEIVRLKNRAIIDFKDPIRSGQYNRNQNFATGGTSFYNQNNLNNSRNSVNTTSPTIGRDAVVESIEKIIPEQIKSGLEITTDYGLNGFIVSGPGAKVEKFKDFIKQIDVAVPLIFIEVMILELDRTSILETGVSFGIGDAPTNTSGTIFPSTSIQIGAQTINKVISPTGSFSGLNLGQVLPNFWLDIKANEANGNLKILSTPQLSALNGHSAYLSSSQTSYYAITNQTIIGSQNPQTTETRNYAPVSAELAIDIRPIVTQKGHITLDIKVIQSSFSGERIDEDAPPDINTREFSSIIKMKVGETAMLGGIKQIVKDDSGSGIPLLARIPIIKYLFSQRRREASKRSLTILIKPTVIY